MQKIKIIKRGSVTAPKENCAEKTKRFHIPERKITDKTEAVQLLFGIEVKPAAPEVYTKEQAARILFG